MRLRIRSDGTPRGSRVETEDGALVHGVMSAVITLDALKRPTVQLEVARTAIDIETDAVLSGADLIAIERRRQVIDEGWIPEHDASHRRAELVDAAIAYASAYTEKSPPFGRWPWQQRWWKPSDRKRNLVKAGALIAAEIDRLQRQERS